MRLAVMSSIVSLLALLAAPARADDDVAAFYRGKTITITNAFAEGGLYANLARLVALHMPRHIPGKPGAVPQFMPGAAGLRQMNHLYNAAARDGTVIALMYDNMPITQVLTDDGSVKFDARRFASLGSFGRGEPGSSASSSAPASRPRRRAQDANRVRRDRHHVGAIHHAGDDEQAVRHALQADPRLPHHAGNLSRDGARRGRRRLWRGRDHPGEPADWIAEQRFNWLAQLNDVREGEFADVPLLQELAQAPLDKAAFNLLALARVPGKSLLAAARRAAGADRGAARGVRRDGARPGFPRRCRQDHAEGRAAHLAGRRAVIRETIDTPPDVVAHVRDLLKVGNP